MTLGLANTWILSDLIDECLILRIQNKHFNISFLSYSGLSRDKSIFLLGLV